MLDERGILLLGLVVGFILGWGVRALGYHLGV